MRQIISTRLGTSLAAAVLLGCCMSAAAQQPGKDASGIALYQGSDRVQRVLEGAKKERRLTVYTSAPADDYAAFSEAFEKKYGIKVSVWRASSEKVQQRGVTEARAGRYEVDVFDTNGPEMEALHREKVLQEVKSPHLGDLIPQAIMPHREWVGTRLNVFALAYNTRLVKKEELPKKWEDLADPRWKGRLGIEAADEDWFAGVMSVLGEQRGLRIFRDIVTRNGLSVRKGHTLLTNLVAAGEVPLALTVYNYKAEQLKNKGAPIDWFVIPPAIARPNGIGMARRAPHPNAAVLFYDFMISDAQFLLLERDFVPTSKKIKTKLNQMPLKFVDPAEMLDNDAKWTKLYEEIVNRQGR